MEEVLDFLLWLGPALWELLTDPAVLWSCVLISVFGFSAIHRRPQRRDFEPEKMLAEDVHEVDARLRRREKKKGWRAWLSR